MCATDIDPIEQARYDKAAVVLREPASAQNAVALANHLPSGVYSGIPDEVYHALPLLGSSDLKHLGGGATLAELEIRRAVGFKSTPAMKMGIVIDTLITQPERWDDLVVVSDLDGRTKAGKLLKKTEQEGADRLIIKSDDAYRAEGMRRSILRSKGAEMLDDGNFQGSVFWSFDGTKVDSKARFDAASGDTLWDLKKCQSTDPRALRMAFAKYRYDLQAAWYTYGGRTEGVVSDESDFRFLCVEEHAPYLTEVVQFDEEVMAQAFSDITQLRRAILEAEQSGNWPGRPTPQDGLTFNAHDFLGLGFARSAMLRNQHAFAEQEVF